MVAAEQLYGYRNKVEYSWSQGAAGPALGYHQLGRWDRLIAVDHCHIASDAGNEVRRAFETWARELGLRAYDQRSGDGWLRHLVVREGVRTGELLAVLVTAPGDVPGVDRLAELMPAGVVGVVHATNAGVAEVTAGHEQSVLIGRDWFGERIGGLEFRVSAGAFMQTNTVMAERLYAIAIEFAELRPDDVVWDLYCGAGAIGLLAAPGAAAVYGIEISAESIAGARRMPSATGSQTPSSSPATSPSSVRPLLERVPRPDVVFVDPPRSGLTPRAVRRVIELAPQRLVYVSCNPTTFAPNARQLVDAGYVLERVRPLDMFPHTPHIECVARASPRREAPT